MSTENRRGSILLIISHTKANQGRRIWFQRQFISSVAHKELTWNARENLLQSLSYYIYFLVSGCSHLPWQSVAENNVVYISVERGGGVAMANIRIATHCQAVINMWLGSNWEKNCIQ
jgi:hypothetical protein